MFPIDLQGHNGDWGTQARALQGIRKVDSDVAKKVAMNNEAYLVKAVSELQRSDCEDDDIAMYLTVLQQLDADSLRCAIEKVDPVKAEVSWKQRLGDRRVCAQRAVAILASVGLTCDGPIADVSRTLLSRIPQRVRDQVT